MYRFVELILFMQAISSQSARIVKPNMWKLTPSTLRQTVFLSPEEEHAASSQSRIAKLWEECQILKDKVWHDRIQSEGAVWALACYGLVDSDEEVRTASAAILHEFEMPPSIAPVAKIFAQKLAKSDSRRLYVEALEETKDAWRDRKIAREVAWAIARYGLVDDDEATRVVSARILKELGMPKSVARAAKSFAEGFMNSAAYGEAAPRRIYVQALDQTKSAWYDQIQAQDAVWALARYGLIDDDEEVRSVSASILHELGMPRLVAKAAKIFAEEIKSTSGHEADVRRRYLWALDALELQAEEAAKLLTSYHVGSGAEEVRRAAHQILEKIRRQKYRRQEKVDAYVLQDSLPGIQQMAR